MKRFLVLLFVFFLFYLGLQLGFRLVQGESSNEYKVGKDKKYQVKETLTTSKIGENDYYEITISDENLSFTYQIYENLGKKERIVQDVRSYADSNYTCILPIFRDGKHLTDITCYFNGTYTFYHNLIGRDSELDTFVSTLSEKEYQKSLWTDTASPYSVNDNVTIWKDNLASGHYLAFENYRGLYLFNLNRAKNTYLVDLFHQDVYQAPIAGNVLKHYVLADYNEKYEFTKLYCVDMTTLKTETLDLPSPISFDSYVQGSVEDSLYIFDRSNKVQYEVNLKTREVSVVGNVDSKVKYYHNGTWETISAYEASSSNVLFKDDYHELFPSYEKVDKVELGESGFYYLYERAGNRYNVYRTSIQDTSKRTYLFQMSSLSEIHYSGAFVYYKEGDIIYCYHDSFGIRKIYQNRELQFNSNLHFAIYG